MVLCPLRSRVEGVQVARVSHRKVFLSILPTFFSCRARRSGQNNQAIEFRGTEKPTMYLKTNGGVCGE